jgi:hypothetical protein
MTKDEAIQKLWNDNAITDAADAKKFVEGLSSMGLLTLDTPKTEHQVIAGVLTKRFGNDLAQSVASELRSAGLRLRGDGAP